jgi:hypothetical protein
LLNEVSAQQRGGRNRPSPPVTLGLEQGFIDINTPDFNLKLVRASQTIAALEPKGANGFDFTPADWLKRRASDGYNHLGDITLRIYDANSKEWKSYLTSAKRKPVNALAVSGQVLAAADLSPTLPEDCPLNIIRTWTLEGGKLVLKFELKNKTNEDVQIGALGIPMIFNNIITNRRLKQAHEKCSFFDPYIGLDAGYLQVTRLTGSGPALVVVPEGKTPFEAYQLLNEPTPPNQTFEGTFEWLVHSKAYADKEWKGVTPWNEATSVTIAAGKSKTYGVRFLVADEIRNIEKTLIANKRPVAVGIPGYILPMDIDGKLFIKYQNTEIKTAITIGQRIFAEVVSIDVEPKEAITIEKNGTLQNGWSVYTLHGKNWGRARVTVNYQDGLKQSISYYVIKPAAQAVADLGNFLMTKQWFVDPCDYFHRSPSVMSYDREVNKIVTQDSRVWIAGLGDEGGSGSYLAAAMKEFGQPKKEELIKYEQFVNKTLWGGIQYSEGSLKYGVRKSMFYYEPNELPAGFYRSDMDWRSWTSWNKRGAEKIDRAYNYPHVAATYWSMYRLARNNKNLVTSHPWDWYLDQAYQTIKFLTGKDPNGNYNVGYIDTGLMEGTVFVKILEDLKSEGWREKAADMESKMKERADNWKKEEYPFGSEMAWDSTGQEEVYAWCKYFRYNDKALVSLSSILGYMPTVPHWGYNGNARRYWDFLYGGKLSRYERQIHHYGSGMNAIPVLSEYRENPDDYYLLRIGYGGMMGALSNIDQEGFASAAFHSFPNTLKWDAYSGDYGPNFLGHAINTATYIIKHPEFGWQAFGGNVKVDGNIIKVSTLDSMRRRVYIAPFGLWLHLGAGTFEQVEIDADKKTVKLSLSPATEYTPNAILRVEQPARITGIGTFKPTGKLETERGAYVVPLKTKTIWVEISQVK